MTVGAVVIRSMLVLALQPLLDDVHVQEPEKAAAEAETQRLRDFRLVVQRRIVQFELVERVAQRFVLVGFHRVEPGEHLRLDVLEAGQRGCCRPRRERHRVADLGRVDLLDARDDETDFARPTTHRAPPTSA